MLKTILPAEMKTLEEQYMQRTGVPGSQLMELAATHLADAAERLHTGGRVECFCGPGNNGGDGLAAMRILAGRKADFRGCCWLLSEKLSADASAQLDRLRQEAPMVEVKPAAESFPTDEKPGLVIDALFGTGLARELTGQTAELCRKINELADAGVPVLAVDIPSGLDGSTGRILGTAVRATETVTFHRPKPGLYLNHGLDCAGRVTVGDIGIPEDDSAPEGLSILQRDDVSCLLPKRLHNSHKGSYGRLLIVAGSVGMAGAAALCATAALRSGAGLVTVACPENVLPIVQNLCPCATALPLPEDAVQAVRQLRRPVKQADAVAIGCGMGQSEWAQFLLYGLLDMVTRSGKPAVLDADGLNLLAQMGERPRLERCILTPHPAEAARLLGETTSAVLADPVSAAKRLHQQYGAAVVLKGSSSVLAAEDGMGLNVFGTPAMAKGGSGDVLTGILGALLAGKKAGAYRLNQLEILQLGCALHGLAGMAAEETYGSRGVLATDLCQELGRIH